MQPDELEIDESTASRFVQLVLNCIQVEYPHSNIYWFDSDEDIKPPHKLTPAFYGCLDWHSAVHGHWLLVRLLRYFPASTFSPVAKQVLSQSLTPEKIHGEVMYFQRHPFFECPYGMSWLLQLAAELYEWNDSEAQKWRTTLEPLEKLVAGSLYRWLQALKVPDRTGMHNQTAFSLNLILDWARITVNTDFIQLIEKKAREFYFNDRDYPLYIEPLGYDFSSPCLAVADLMRRLLTRETFSDWLNQFLPQIPIDGSINWLKPVEIEGSKNYMLSHFYGLNLSRAWMMEGIISGLPKNDGRIKSLKATAIQHRQIGLAKVVSEDYSSSHWLGTFAVYLITNRGLPYGDVTCNVSTLLEEDI